MLEENRLVELFQSLPVDQKREVIDFVEFLKQRKGHTNDQPKQFTVGFMKGFVTFMADDFDAPLEDFSDYM